MEQYVKGSVSAIVSQCSSNKGNKQKKRNLNITNECDSNVKENDFDHRTLGSKKIAKTKKCEATEVPNHTIHEETEKKKRKIEEKKMNNLCHKKKHKISHQPDNNILTEPLNEIIGKTGKSKNNSEAISDSGEYSNGQKANDLGTDTILPKDKYKQKKLEKLEDSSKDKNTVFVGNLPLTYNHKKVHKLFGKFGAVESARIRCVPVSNVSDSKKKSAILKSFHPKRKSAAAFVVFKSEESVTKAVAANGMVVNGHHLRIDTLQPRRKDLKKSVFVGGLPFDVEDDELWDAFQNCGDIQDVRVVRDEKTAMGKGFGYVNFKSEASVELALKLNGHEIKGRKINVQRCNSSKKKSKLKPIPYEIKSVNKRKKQKSLRLKSDQPSQNDFQGMTAHQKLKKKKKKLTKNAALRNKIKAVFGSS